MTTNWLSQLVRCRYEPKFLPYLLAILRIAICFTPQTGYLHPDEFFQSTDLVGGNYFKSRIEPVWEFKVESPIRCMLIPSLLNNLSFKIVSLLQSMPTAYTLLVAPRLSYTILSFIIDLCLFKLCHYHSTRGLWYLPVSVIFQTSFICLGCLTRTFSNVPEAVIFALLLVVVCQTVRPTFRIIFIAQNRTTPINQRAKKSRQILSSTLVGFITTLGTFNRPTFPCFALVPLSYWLIESWKRNSYKANLTLQRVLVPIILSSSVTALLISAFDTYYYKGIEPIEKVLMDLKRLDLKGLFTHLGSNWILTPYNFINFNKNASNLVQYGLHPPYMHMLINIPFAFNLLGFMYYARLINLLIGSGINRLLFSTHRVYALMLLTVVISTLMLSFIPHQEFRFLLPIIVPLVYAFSFNIYSSNRLLILWLVANFSITYFYSYVHQSGVIKACLDLDQTLKSHVSSSSQHLDHHLGVVALKSYRLPTYQWNIPNSTDWITILPFHDQQEVNTTVETTAQLFWTGKLSKQKYDIYFMVHSLFEDRLVNRIIDTLPPNSSYQLGALKRYFPHFSGEELGDTLEYLKQVGWRGFRKAFSFSLVHLQLATESESESEIGSQTQSS